MNRDAALHFAASLAVFSVGGAGRVGRHDHVGGRPASKRQVKSKVVDEGGGMREP
jgi:hypothetical protein